MKKVKHSELRRVVMAFLPAILLCALLAVCMLASPLRCTAPASGEDIRTDRVPSSSDTALGLLLVIGSTSAAFTLATVAFIMVWAGKEKQG